MSKNTSLSDDLKKALSTYDIPWIKWIVIDQNYLESFDESARLEKTEELMDFVSGQLYSHYGKPDVKWQMSELIKKFLSLGADPLIVLPKIVEVIERDAA
jgi:hypothetical protein